MSTRQSNRGKSKTGDPVNSELEDNGHPVRLFATDRYPCERVNMYSTVDLLLWVRDVLRGSPEMDVLMGSCFAGLFQIPTRRLLAGKVVHSMMTRQVVTKKKYEMWPVFGGNPFRFSLVEFGEVTGLPCGEFEEGYSIDYQLPEKEENFAFWDRLFCDNRDATIGDVIALVESDDHMPGDIRLKLCLIVIVDGVLVATSQKARPSLKYVKLLENLDDFMAFPWGRESFLWTISTLKPRRKVMGKCEDPIVDFCNQLRQKTIKTVGFPLALQLVAFRSIPQLLELAAGEDTITVLNYPGSSLPKHAGLTEAAVRKAEHNPALTVKPMLVATGNHEDRWALWDDENYDKRVNSMVGLIERGHVFTKAEWLGGDAGDPLFVYGAQTRTTKRKNQVDSDEGAPTKQRRVSDRSTRSAHVAVDDDKLKLLEERIDEVVAEVASLREVCKKQEDMINSLKLSLERKDNQKTRMSSKKTHKSTLTQRGRAGLEISGNSAHTPGEEQLDVYVREASTGVVGSAGSGGQESAKCVSGVEPQGQKEDTTVGCEAHVVEGINPAEEDFLDLLVGAVMTDAGLSPGVCTKERPTMGGPHRGADASTPLGDEAEPELETDAHKLNKVADSVYVDEIGSGDDLTDEESPPVVEETLVPEVGFQNKDSTDPPAAVPQKPVFSVDQVVFDSGLQTTSLTDPPQAVAQEPTVGGDQAGFLITSPADPLQATPDVGSAQAGFLITSTAETLQAIPDVGGAQGDGRGCRVFDDQSESVTEANAESIDKVACDVQVDTGSRDTLKDDSLPELSKEQGAVLGPTLGITEAKGAPGVGLGNDGDMGVFDVPEVEAGDGGGETDDDMTDGETEHKDGESRVTVLSDSPTPTTARHIPGPEEEELASLLMEKSVHDLADMVPVIEDRDYPFFERVLQANPEVMHHNAGGRDLDNVFFLDLATPGRWVSSTHMEVLMEYSERRHGLELHLNGAMFLAPWFTAHMQGKGRSFRAARRKTCIAGDAKITNYLTQRCKRWGVEVNSLYTPMIWGGCHWVGLWISLREWTITVLDPNPGLKTMEQVEKLMEPVACMLPYIAKKVCPPETVGERQQVPFRVTRLDGLYQNVRGGDCGPVAVKFLEMHATGNRRPTMSGLNDDFVVIIRRHYAMDIYKGVVLPLYLNR